MDENIKTIIFSAPFVLSIGFLFFRTFFIEPEFRKGIYYILLGGAGFFGWCMFVKYVL